MDMPETPLQTAERGFNSAQSTLARATESAAELERTRLRIDDELEDLEIERKSLAVAAAKGKSGPKTRVTEIVARRSELMSEKELVETAILEIQDQTETAQRKHNEAEAAVVEELTEIRAGKLTKTGAAVDDALKALSAALSQHHRAINDLGSLGSNGNPVLARHNGLMAEVIHRVGGVDIFEAAIANVPGLARQLNRAGHIPVDAFKSMEAAMTELCDGHFRRR